MMEVEDMDLELLVEQRIRDAKNKGYKEKASLIAEMLGTKSKERRGHVYQKDSEWDISHLCYSSWNGMTEDHDYDWHTIVKYQQQEVFYAKHYDGRKEENIHVYLPGEWEQGLDDLYSQAVEVKEEQERREEEERLREKQEREREHEEDLRSRFGL